MEDKFVLLHLVFRQCIAELREESDFNACCNFVDRLVVDLSLDSAMMKNQSQECTR
jgi:hypothetical protein